jgi:UDP-N-acetylglucosamine 2-epimerase (non-hydrolysing)
MLAALPRSRRILAGRTGRKHIVLTHGDTFTTWLGALMGRLTGTRVMHVEAGLRSFNLLRPFPEELNRLITFRLAHYYACPGDWAVANLRRYRGTKIDTVTNTQLDTLRFGLDHLEGAEVELPDAGYVVASIHRYENIFKRERFDEIVRVLERVAERFRVLFILHPATRGQIEKFGYRERLERNPHIDLLPRLEYLPFLKAVTRSEFVVTDGGGNQEELSYLGKPVLILRNETERREGIGANALVATSLDDAVVDDFVAGYTRYRTHPTLPSGSPAATIVDWLAERGFGAT